MKGLNCASIHSDSKCRSCLWMLFTVLTLICSAYFIGSAFVGEEYKDKLMRWQVFQTLQRRNSNKCMNDCRPSGSESLPQGIVAKTSNFEMQPLWSSPLKDNKPKTSMNLLAIAVGIKQKEIVDQIVKKFPLSHFILMLFHYDGVVEKWKDLSWSDHAVHVSAVNQTKWWFAKRFLHPDIVAEYDYIFIWDEDLGVENFDPRRYLAVVKDEGLEISQPALDPVKSEVHHPITARQRKPRVHRRMYKFKGHGRCNDSSTSPPCTGWVEMMAPVFSRAAWRCAWYMIQNDLIHAWGLDLKLGYCAQGYRTRNVGVVDSDYIVHMGLQTLGVFNGSELNNLTQSRYSHSKDIKSSGSFTQPGYHKVDSRPEVRRQSFIEMEIFKTRWQKAIREDKCWVDPYHQQIGNQSNHQS